MYKQIFENASFTCLLTENREDMLNPANNKLTDVLEEANKLFANGINSTACSLH